jgi:hypothetical protein
VKKTAKGWGDKSEAYKGIENRQDRESKDSGMKNTAYSANNHEVRQVNV